ncbi:hypothetical protein pdam_00024966 [Pocillopora damicornis]|uniref:Uncharacterized protein n=1 Tax=Pocillopora damicornis TaxID=46731 RepID=A0A3M6TZ04_POCDA|nr:hypothetical protein pdam_00024966 [Pocillopora damicornis]
MHPKEVCLTPKIGDIVSENGFTLKPSSQFYFQLQLQMFVSELPLNVWVVWTEQDAEGDDVEILRDIDQSNPPNCAHDYQSCVDCGNVYISLSCVKLCMVMIDGYMTLSCTHIDSIEYPHQLILHQAAHGHDR